MKMRTTCVLVVLSTLHVIAGNANVASLNMSQVFNCKNGVGWTTRKEFCNEEINCRDGSDEVLYNETIHGNLSGVLCRRWVNGGARACYLPEDYVCDHELDCFFGTDECNCKHTFKCVTPVPLPMCRLRVQFCDNVKDCIYDGSDEWKYEDGKEGFQCSVTKTHLTNYCMLPTDYVCDGVSDCDDGTDECFCTSQAAGTYDDSGYLNDNCFRCFDESLVIPAKKLCDGVFHCRDLSDECLCPDEQPHVCQQVCPDGQNCTACSFGQVACSVTASGGQTICINRTQVCDRTFDCPNHEDEKNCELHLDQIFECSDGLQYFPKYMYCDNVPDCKDGSDEIGCSDLYPCKSYRMSTTKPGAYLFAEPRYAHACDGIAECQDLDDECNASLCHDAAFQPSYCSHVQGELGFICRNSQSRLIGQEICDGFPSCNDTFPHLSEDEFNCTGRFYCADHGRSQLPIHIPLEKKCNGVSDCFDISDEIGCNQTTHFYCPKGNPIYIPLWKVCNGVQECENGEDECQNCATSPFSSDKFLINTYVLQVVVWITGLFAVFGNIAVLIHNGKHLWKNKKTMKSIAIVNRILVLNLSMADLLLGVHLITVAIVNSVYENVYCRKDIEWRGSSACTALGSLATISMETSVFVLAIMTVYRYRSVTNPFGRYFKSRTAILLLFGAWCTSFILAFVPLSPSLEDYFVSGIWYKNNPFLADPTRGDVEKFVVKLRTFESSVTGNFSKHKAESLTWTSMIATIAKLRSNFLPKFNFGYYSAHGVCLPRLFPDPVNDKSWGYSLAIVILNFIIFICVAVMHFFIYRVTASSARRSGRNSDVTQALQRKVTTIVITNSCCWFPVCIMAFISVGGIALSGETYSWSAIVLLPINSAANPFFYSNLPDILWKKLEPLRKRVGSLFRKEREEGSSSIAMRNTQTTTRTQVSSGGSSRSIL